MERESLNYSGFNLNNNKNSIWKVTPLISWDQFRHLMELTLDGIVSTLALWFQKIQLFAKSARIKIRTKKIFLSAGLQAVGKYCCLQIGELSQKSTVSIEKLCGSKAEVRVHRHGS